MRCSSPAESSWAPRSRPRRAACAGPSTWRAARRSSRAAPGGWVCSSPASSARQGAKVVLLARDQAELERAERRLADEGIDASIIVSDLADGAAAERAVDAVISRHGAIDVLVNNAGIITVGPIEHVTVEDFEESMAVHFWGPLHTMRAAIPHMRRHGGGRIVNISSIGGKIGVPAPGGLLRRQVRAHRPLERADARTGARQHRRHHRVPRADADRLALQRVVQGPSPAGVRVVRHRRFAAAAVGQRAPRRSADRRRDAPRRCRARHHVGGSTRRPGGGGHAEHRRAGAAGHERAVAGTGGARRRTSGAAAGRACPTGRHRRSSASPRSRRARTTRCRTRAPAPEPSPAR